MPSITFPPPVADYNVIRYGGNLCSQDIVDVVKFELTLKTE